MVGLIDEQDKVLYLRRLPNDLAVIVKALEPFQEQIEGLVVESTYNWYWLIDGLQEAGYEAHLALYWFFANLYLDDFDHWVKEGLRAPAYLRYVDDMVLLHDDKNQLAEWRAAIRERLVADRLLLHPRKAHIYPTQVALNLLGYLVSPHQRWLRNDNGYRFRRQLRAFAQAYAEGRMDWQDFNPSVQSWIGHACHADTLGLRQRLFDDVCFQRGTGRG